MAKASENMAELSNQEWFDKNYGKSKVDHNAGVLEPANALVMPDTIAADEMQDILKDWPIVIKDSSPDNDQKQPEAESQVMVEKNKDATKPINEVLSVKEERSLAATPFRPIRQNRSKVNLGDGIAGGLLLAQLQAVLPVQLDETPSSKFYVTDEELVSNGIPAASVKKYRFFNDVMRSPNSTSERQLLEMDALESNIFLPPTASSIAGLRGLQMMQLQLNQSIVNSGTDDAAEHIGDPDKDEEWLKIMQQIFSETGTLLGKDLDHLFRGEHSELARLDQQRPSPPSTQVQDGPPAKKKKTRRASQQSIGTKPRDYSCPLAKELARLDELKRQQPTPPPSEVQDGPPAKKKKTRRASQQPIRTKSRDYSCPLEKELARLDELKRQQPTPPSSKTKTPSRKKKTHLAPRSSQKLNKPSFSDGPTASCSGNPSEHNPSSKSKCIQLSDSDSD